MIVCPSKIRLKNLKIYSQLQICFQIFVFDFHKNCKNSVHQLIKHILHIYFIFEWIYIVHACITLLDINNLKVKRTCTLGL